jgi:UDP-N-acetylglucosamine 2-epimerase (non-hydrolysing)
MKVMVVFGTRPEAIKMCPLVLELKKRSEIETIVCTTGQHKEMLDQVMEVFHVTENYNLSIMEEKQTLSMITSKVLLGIDEILKTEKPDIMLVHGDTTTSFAASLSAFYHQISVGHVEAGLRTYDLYSPFPEEFNRQAVDIVSDLYFAPTELAKKQLLREGKSEKNIIVTGNTVIDALSTTIKKEYYHEELEWAKGSKLILFTAHRRENIGQPMQNIFHALCKIVNENKNVKVIYPIHKNPKVREIADEILGNQERIHMIEPLDVFDFHNFIARSYMVMTDSGGIQEEAPSLGKPVLVLRDTTERPEGVAAGTLKLTGTQEDTIYRIATQLLNNKEMYNKMSIASNPYGDGHASKRIVEYLLQSIS